jgi:hypothetical protein
MISSLLVACNPTPNYSREKCDQRALQQQYAKECYRYYPANHAYIIRSGGYGGGYTGGGYYQRTTTGTGGTKVTKFAPIRTRVGSSGFGSFGRSKVGGS